MNAEEVAPLVYEAWRGALHRLLIHRNIPDPDLAELWLRWRLSEAPMEEALFQVSGQRWWDDPGTVERESREDAIETALTEALASLAQTFGDSIDAWQWGKAHSLTMDHPFGSIPLLRHWFGSDPRPTSGGRHTLWALDHLGVLGNFAVDSGPALRQVVTPGGEAGFVLAGGNVGITRSPWASNQLEAWYVGSQHDASVDAPVDTSGATLVILPNDVKAGEP